jgi:hypothetical protein
MDQLLETVSSVSDSLLYQPNVCQTVGLAPNWRRQMLYVMHAERVTFSQIGQLGNADAAVEYSISNR